MNVVIPIAGRGARLSKFERPKPLIEIQGRTLFEWSTVWLSGRSNLNVTVVALAEHEENFNISDAIRKVIPWANCVLIDKVTEGQLCTVLCAEEFIDPELPLLVSPCDTYVEDFPCLSEKESATDADGVMTLARKSGDRWSFAVVRDDWTVVQVAEKIRISDWASTGHYYFRSSRDFLQSAKELIADNERANGEFYIMPLYQRMLGRGSLIKGIPVSCMIDLGSEEGLVEFVGKRKWLPTGSEISLT